MRVLGAIVGTIVAGREEMAGFLGIGGLGVFSYMEWKDQGERPMGKTNGKDQGRQGTKRRGFQLQGLLQSLLFTTCRPTKICRSKTHTCKAITWPLLL